MHSSTRRNFLGAVVSTGLASMVPSRRLSPPASNPRDKTFLEVIRQPDSATVFQDLDRPRSASRAAALWRSGEVLLRIEPEQNDLPIYISAPGTRLTHVHLRWNTDVPSSILVMGDAWERSYGDLRWSYVIPERVMPWYFLTYGEKVPHGPIGIHSRPRNRSRQSSSPSARSARCCRFSRQDSSRW
jgi:alpha-galactosidase